MRPRISLTSLRLPAMLLTGFVAASASARSAQIKIFADQVLHPVSRYLTGACIEDVNHEIYGGIYSQLIFGESFAEPAPQPPLHDFNVFGGRWALGDDGSVQVVGSDGAKIVWDGPGFSEGEASVDLWLTEAGGGNAGLILKVSDAGKGADAFNGYEVSLERPGTLVIGRHRQNWEPIRRVPCAVPVNQWVTLTVRMTANSLEVRVNGKAVTKYEDTEHPLETGKVGLRTWQREVRFRHFAVTTGGVKHEIPFELAAKKGWSGGVSGMWRAIREGTATGSFSLESKSAFSGHQSQQITFLGGSGVIGIENQSLNRWGMNFVKAKPYEGFLYVRAATPTEFFVALESRNGGRVYAEKKLKTRGSQWRRVDFTLKPKESDHAGRFVIKLKEPGTLSVGYAFLQPGEWGRFKGLPVRKDVAEGLIHQGITVLRLGGSMVNAPGYRWKKMTGPREFRPPYHGTWYPYSSDGWGIFDFLNFCEAAGFVGVPDFNLDETPQDMADFIEYVNGPAESKWGRKRVADGHPQPYHLKHIEIGNEERVNDHYYEKFKAIAEAVWAKDPDIILIVGDFAYGRPIEDPFHFTGAAGGITSLEAQQKILRLAKEHNREVWFDVHIGTEGPRPDFGGFFSYIDALDKLADGAKHRVLTFEFNANNHSMRRALANATAINALERDGRVPIGTSANCLQPDGQNDNGWNQGLLFLNPSQVWLQPPGYVTQMISFNYEPLEVKCEVENDQDNLDVSAKRSADGKTLVLQVVNVSDLPMPSALDLEGFAPTIPVAKVEELLGPLHASNNALAPDRIKPCAFTWHHALHNGGADYVFPPYSFTVIRFE